MRSLLLLAVALAIALPGDLLGADGGAQRCQGRAATIVGTAGPDRLRGTDGSDVVVAGDGDDAILGRGGNDRICGGEASDRILGGRGVDELAGQDGEDRLEGGRASDLIRGGSGDDRLIGERGNDRAHGGAGRDLVDSGLGDDTLHGGDGDDVLIAGLGIDHLFGEAGDDLVRGDFGPDELAGGRGRDVASFAMATPPGPGNLDGVLVDLDRGWSLGDGRPDRLRSIEDVAGSAFADVIRGDARGNRTGGRERPDHGARAEVLDGPAPVLVVLGGHGADRIEVTRRGAAYRVRGVRPRSGCRPAAGAGVLCRAAGGEVTGLLVFGGAGQDSLRVADRVSGALAVKVDGYRGDDRLAGSGGADVLDGGPGRDALAGRAGSDAVVARSGGDRVRGGAGSDLLVVADPCEGHRLGGGPGIDSASFSRLHYRDRHRGVRARIGGLVVTTVTRCAHPDRIRGSVESLEGSWGPDLLIGDGSTNTLLGRAGDDLLLGAGGADRLVGGTGSDRLAGGPGADRHFR